MDMLKSDAQVLLQVLDFQDKEKLILIKEDKDSDANFVITHALRHVFQDQNKGLCLVMLQNNITHYQIVGKRLNYNLLDNINTKQACITDVCKMVVDDIGSDGDKLVLNDDTDKVAENLYKNIETNLCDLMQTHPGIIYIVVDNLSCLLHLGLAVKDCVFLINALLNFDDRVNLIVGTHNASHDDDYLTKALSYISDIIISVDSLKSGRSNIVTGQMNIKRQDMPIQKYHFKNTDKGVKIFKPGDVIKSLHMV